MADSGPNKDEKLNDYKNPSLKPLNKEEESNKELVISTISVKSSALAHSVSVPSIIRRHNSLLSSNLSLNASCSSDASSDSFHSRASTGRIGRTSRKKQVASRPRNCVVSDGFSESFNEGVKLKTRCSWATVCTGELLAIWLSLACLNSFVFAERDCDAIEIVLFEFVSLNNAQVLVFEARNATI